MYCVFRIVRSSRFRMRCPLAQTAHGKYWSSLIPIPVFLIYLTSNSLQAQPGTDVRSDFVADTLLRLHGTVRLDFPNR